MSKYLSFNIGDKVEFTPSGMWGHRVWQNAATHICTGIKIVPVPEDYGLNRYQFRFTRIGDASVSDSYPDIFMHPVEINRFFDESKDEVSILGGWVKPLDKIHGWPV